MEVGGRGAGGADVTAVKEYVRAGAGHSVPHPNDLRPPDVLAATMDYLIRKYVSINKPDAVGLDVGLPYKEMCAYKYIRAIILDPVNMDDGAQFLCITLKGYLQISGVNTML